MNHHVEFGITLIYMVIYLWRGVNHHVESGKSWIYMVIHMFLHFGTKKQGLYIIMRLSMAKHCSHAFAFSYILVQITAILEKTS